MNSFGAIVLAAGNSERFGTPKALLSFGNKRTFIEQIIEIYLEGEAEKIVLVINPTIANFVQSLSVCQKSRVLIVENSHPEKGRLYSMKLGLEKLDDMPVFIQNVDNPFVSVVLIQKMVLALKSKGYVSPCFQGSGGHPILIAKEIAQVLEHNEMDYPLHLFLTGYEQIKIEQNNPKVLVNINTPDDYRSYFK